MNSLKYYVISAGMMLTFSGSAIVLAEEVENEPITIQENEVQEITYTIEDGADFDNTDLESFILEDCDLTIIDGESNNESSDLNVSITDNSSDNTSILESAETVLTDGWGQDSSGKYYVVDGSKLNNTVHMIDNHYYGFDYSGYLYQNTTFFWNGFVYRAKSDGTLYVNEWYQDSFGKYYYGEAGQSANGLVTVDGVVYCFQGGMLSPKTIITDENGYAYYSDENSIAKKIPDGWNNLVDQYNNEATYYVADGKLIRNQVYSIDSNFYYFGYAGNLLKNERDIYTGYVADGDGVLYRNKWYTDEDNGKNYYYGDDCKPIKGFQSVDNKKYYFNNNSEMVYDTALTIDGKVYIFQENGSFTVANDGWNTTQSNRYFVKNGILSTCTILEEDGIKYLFDGEGKQVIDSVCSIYDSENNKTYYYATDKKGKLVTNRFVNKYYFGCDGKALSDGFATIDGFQYYFENGVYLNNTIKQIDGINYIFDLVGCASVAAEGITHNINTYYVIDGQLAEGIHNIDGKQYYFNQGIALKNNMVQLPDTSTIVATDDGTLLKSGWYKHTPHKAPTPLVGIFYVNEKGNVVSGLQEIDGKQYIFGPYGGSGVHPMALNHNAMFKVEGKWYYSNDYGVLNEVEPSNGWVICGKDTFYFSEGNYVTGLNTINGKEYYFDYSGILQKDAFIFDLNATGHIQSRTDSDGKIIKNKWINVNSGSKYDGIYYFTENGYTATGFMNINGKDYYFNKDGRMYASEIVEINHVLYKFEADGSYTTDVKDGWYDGRSIQLVRNGVLVRNQIIEYEGDYYLVGASGSSKWDVGYNNIFGYRVFDKTTGSLARNEFSIVTANETSAGYYGANNFNVYDLYSGDDGQISIFEGIVQNGGNQYALIYENRAAGLTRIVRNTSLLIKGVNYYADENGVLHETVKKSGHTLSLEGNIGVNFYLDFGDDVLADEGAKLELSVDGKIVSLNVKDAVKQNNYRKFAAEVTSAQMATDIVAKLILSDGNVVYTEKYSVKQYCDNMLAKSSTSEKLRSLLEALLNYGGYAQTYFKYNTGNLANNDLTNPDVSDVTAEVLSTYKIVKKGSQSGLTFKGSTLVLESLTSIRHYFVVGNDYSINEYTFKVDGKTVKPIASGDRYYVEIPNIASGDLDKMYEVSVGGFALKYSALSYAYNWVNKTGDYEALQNVCRALYKYNQAANGYFTKS